jgi:hypothetical protein
VLSKEEIFSLRKDTWKLVELEDLIATTHDVKIE